MTLVRFSGRAGVAVLAAVSAGLSMALISLAKVLLVVTALLALLTGWRSSTGRAPLEEMWTPRLVLLILFVFSCSLFWTTAVMPEALGAMGKYGKLLVIPALLILVRRDREAFFVLAAFMGAQLSLLFSSWLLYFHVPLPWATSRMATTSYAVFSSYLDQGIMSAVVAAVAWHLRTLAPNRLMFYGAVAISLLATATVFVVFVGRTGQLVSMVMLGLAIFWALPPRYRLLSVPLSLIIVTIAFVGFYQVSPRFSAVTKEASAYLVKPEAQTSTGARLSFWKASLEIIAEEPLIGSGVGSWAVEYERLNRAKNPSFVLDVGNPHQEFLLWGVQLGIGGILLLSLFLLGLIRDFSRLDAPVARAGQSVVTAMAMSFLLNSSLYDAYIGDFFCLLLGILLIYGHRCRRISGSVTS